MKMESIKNMSDYNEMLLRLEELIKINQPTKAESSEKAELFTALDHYSSICF